MKVAGGVLKGSVVGALVPKGSPPNGSPLLLVLVGVLKGSPAPYINRRTSKSTSLLYTGWL